MTESHKEGFCPAHLQSVGFICFFIQLTCEAYFIHMYCIDN